MRYTQSNNLSNPEYKCTEFKDIEKNERKFCVQVVINNKLLAEGFEKNKKASEQKAAMNVLKCLQIIQV